MNVKTFLAQEYFINQSANSAESRHLSEKSILHKLQKFTCLTAYIRKTGTKAYYTTRQYIG